MWASNLRGKAGAALMALSVAAAVFMAAAAIIPTFAAVENKDGYVSAKGGLTLPAVSLPKGTVDINTDDVTELTELPGIGETLAGTIITERKKNGEFHYPEDLLGVRGIGKSKLEKIKDYLDFSQTETR